MEELETIIALSSGSLPSGVAIIRISGPNTAGILAQHGVLNPKPRKAVLSRVHSSINGDLLDRGLVLWFPGPSSFTGEDCAELHVHGGTAVVNAILGSLVNCPGCRLADAGEFSRRAFENGKMDLTEIEGLSDLIAAETEAQRRQALNQGEGRLRVLCEDWRRRLIEIHAMMAAEIDFVDEDDVPEDAGNLGTDRLVELCAEIKGHLEDNRAGEIVRDGYRVAIMGAPNAGKSSLLNTLAKRDVAIVTSFAGTTRDVLDVHLNIDGYMVILTDTAGIRETDDLVEQEGIRRARERGASADLTLWLRDINDQGDSEDIVMDNSVLILKSKDDDGTLSDGSSISCKTGHGMGWLLAEFKKRLLANFDSPEAGVITRLRHRELLSECVYRLEEGIDFGDSDIDLKAEAVRSAGVSLGKLVGKIDVEDLLDLIFSEFCVGK